MQRSGHNSAIRADGAHLLPYSRKAILELHGGLSQASDWGNFADGSCQHRIMILNFELRQQEKDENGDEIRRLALVVVKLARLLQLLPFGILLECGDIM